MSKHFEDEPALKTYSTAGGIKTRYSGNDKNEK